VEAGDGTVGRAHVARVLVRRGLAPSFARAYDRYLGRHAPAYVPSSALSTGEAIRRIRETGGVAVLAHPVQLPDDGIIPVLVREGLDGLEAWSRDSRPSDVERYLRIAREFSLLATGGSDFHGRENFEITLGDVECPEEAFWQLEESWAGRRGQQGPPSNQMN
jgi:predicted metal-dependent phosphoesterase TrpH